MALGEEEREGEKGTNKEREREREEGVIYYSAETEEEQRVERAERVEIRRGACVGRVGKEETEREELQGGAQFRVNKRETRYACKARIESREDSHRDEKATTTETKTRERERERVTNEERERKKQDKRDFRNRETKTRMVSFPSLRLCCDLARARDTLQAR
jgi:hypothetical protein